MDYGVSAPILNEAIAANSPEEKDQSCGLVQGDHGMLLGKNIATVISLETPQFADNTELQLGFIVNSVYFRFSAHGVGFFLCFVGVRLGASREFTCPRPLRSGCKIEEGTHGFSS